MGLPHLMSVTFAKSILIWSMTVQPVISGTRCSVASLLKLGILRLFKYWTSSKKVAGRVVALNHFFNLSMPTERPTREYQHQLESLGTAIMKYGRRK